MDRRDFMKTAAALAVLGAVSKAAKVVAGEPEKKAEPAADNGVPDMVAVRGGEPGEMYAKAIAELGGIGAFVHKGQTVVIKPNIAWDKPPELAANTNPELVGAVVRDCLKAGASKVYVFETTCNFWKDTYKHSGIEDAVKKAGGTMIGGDARNEAYLKEWYEDYTIPGAKALKKVRLHKLVRSCDVFINIPVLKHHGGAKMSCCMKNLMGMICKESQQACHKSLHQSIADLSLIRKPDLNIVDAYRVMTKRGPLGVDSSDVRLLKYLMMGRDEVALDTASAKLMQFPVRRISHISYGQSMGLGTMDLKKLKIKRITL